MSKIYPVSDAVRQEAYIDSTSYNRMYEESIENPASFWERQANKFIDWFKTWDSVFESDFENGHVTWFKNAKLNASFIALTDIFLIVVTKQR